MFYSVLLIAFMSLNLQSITPQSIIKKYQELTTPSGSISTSTLTIIEKSGNTRIREIESQTKRFNDMEKKTIRINAPTDLLGTAFLIYDYKDKNDNVWVYLPAFRKTHRIVSAQKGKEFLGSEFNYYHLYHKNIDDFKYTMETNNTHNIITSIPKSESIQKEYGFLKEIGYFSKKTGLLEKCETFETLKSITKRLVISNYKALAENQTFAAEMMHIENLETKRQSTLKISSIVIKEDIPLNNFTKRALKK